MNFVLIDKNKTFKIVFSSLALSIITGSVIGIFSHFYAIAVISLLFFITLTISNMRYGILFWILTGGLFVIPIYTLRNAGIYPSIIILAFLFFMWIFPSIEEGSFGITKSKLLLPLVFFMITTILSTIKGIILYDPLVHGEHKFILVQIFASITTIFSILTALLIPRFFRTTKHINQIYSVIIILGLNLIIFSEFNLFEIFLNNYWPSWPLMMIAHTASLAYASLLFMQDLINPLKKIVFTLIILFYLGLIIKEFLNPEKGQWMAGWIAIGVPLIFITFYKSKLICTFLIILFCILIISISYKKINDIFTQAEKERSYDRFGIWESSIKIWSKNPFLGVGHGNYMDYSLAYAETQFKYSSAHNQYFQILAELGSLGIICLTWFIYKIFFLGKYLINMISDNFLKTFVVGILGSIYGQLAAGFVADYILPSYHNGGHRNFCTTIYFWILVGSLMAVEEIIKKNKVTRD